jgi:ubiquinone biosynthesis protein UbiJ
LAKSKGLVIKTVVAPAIAPLITASIINLINTLMRSDKEILGVLRRFKEAKVEIKKYLSWIE